MGQQIDEKRTYQYHDLYVYGDIDDDADPILLTRQKKTIQRHRKEETNAPDQFQPSVSRFREFLTTERKSKIEALASPKRHFPSDMLVRLRLPSYQKIVWCVFRAI